MKKLQFVIMFAITLMLQLHLQAQDLLVDSIKISSTKGNDTAVIIIKNNDKLAIKNNTSIYIELHSSNTANNPIAQVKLLATPLLGYATQTFTLSFNAFQCKPGLSMQQATKLIVLLDPKNEIKELSEGNNTKIVILSIKRPHKKVN